MRKAHASSGVGSKVKVSCGERSLLSIAWTNTKPYRYVIRRSKAYDVASTVAIRPLRTCRHRHTAFARITTTHTIMMMVSAVFR